MVVAILIRRLRKGKTYEDFERAWMPDEGFGVPTRVVSLQRVDNSREIVTVGFSDMEVKDVEEFLERVGGQEQVRHERIEDVVEPEMTRSFYIQVGDHDLTNAPPIDWAGAGIVEGARKPENQAGP
jgi:hypothetical protein